MAFPIGPYIPEQPKRRPFGIGPQTGFVQGIATSFASAIEETPVPQFTRFIEAEAQPGPHLTQKEWKNGPWFREGLNFGPQGVNETTAKIAASRHDVKNRQQAILNDMRPGFASGVAQFVGSNMGLVIGNLPAFEAWPAITETTAAYIGTNIWRTETKLAQLGRRAIGGAAAGGITIAPNEFTKFKADQFFGQDTSIIEPILGVGMGAAFGGFIHGFFGRTKILTPRSNNLAKETAVNQLMMGKSVDVMPILKNGYKDATEARAAKVKDIQDQTPELIPQIDEAQQAERTQLQGQLDNLDQQLPVAQTKVDELSRKPLVKVRRERGITLIDKINDSLRTLEGKRTKAQKFVLKNENHLREAQRAMKIRNMPDFARSRSQREHLNRFNNPQGENALVAERLQEHKNKQEVLGAAAQEADMTASTRDNITTQLDRANHQVTMAENRLAELNGAPSFSNSLKAAHVSLFDLKEERNVLRDRLNENNLSLKIQELGPDPVTSSEIKNTAAAIDSVEGDSAFNQIAQDRLDTEMKTLEGSDEQLFDRQAEAAFATVKDMADKGLLKEGAQKDLFEAAQARENDSNILIKGLKDMANCLIGAEAGGIAAEAIPSPLPSRPSSAGVPSRSVATTGTPPPSFSARFLQSEVSVEPSDPRFAQARKVAAGPGGEINVVTQKNLADILPPNTPSVFHETNLKGAVNITRTASQGRATQNFFVSDNIDLALGQKGKNYVLELDPRRINGSETQKLGAQVGKELGIGKELVIDKTISRSIKSIIAPNQKGINALKKDRLISKLFNFDNPIKVERGIKINLKEKK